MITTLRIIIIIIIFINMHISLHMSYYHTKRTKRVLTHFIKNIGAVKISRSKKYIHQDEKLLHIALVLATVLL